MTLAVHVQDVTKRYVMDSETVYALRGVTIISNVWAPRRQVGASLRA